MPAAGAQMQHTLYQWWRTATGVEHGVALTSFNCFLQHRMGRAHADTRSACCFPFPSLQGGAEVHNSYQGTAQALKACVGQGETGQVPGRQAPYSVCTALVWAERGWQLGGRCAGGRAKFSVLALDITSGSSGTGFSHACVNPFWRNEDLYTTCGVQLLLLRKRRLLLEEITRTAKISLGRNILSGTDDPRMLPSVLKSILDAT